MKHDRVWSCERKRKYTKAEAKQVVMRMRWHGARVKAYNCTFCDGWHVANIRRSGRRGRKKN